ncbi:hypothetical protein D7V97_22710, partial [Corallococcus sp. CA053C]
MARPAPAASLPCGRARKPHDGGSPPAGAWVTSLDVQASHQRAATAVAEAHREQPPGPEGTGQRHRAHR